MTDLELAAGLVFGTLEGDEYQRAKIRAVEDRAFAATVAEWEDRLVPLALGATEPLPSGLFEKIEKRIEASGVELPGTFTLRAGSGEWRQVSPGLRVKMLNEIPSVGRQTFMAELQPGAEYVDHDHDQDEEIYMISGDLIIGGLVLKAGDFHVAKHGKHHPTHRTRTGCLCIISQAIGPV
jgi:hypothetical protein